uniref:Uncharacterized protein n=1 Tax=Rhizophora mucronata TaxID=61149 RepID=A0A2P2QDN9_RHIMU
MLSPPIFLCYEDGFDIQSLNWEV